MNQMGPVVAQMLGGGTGGGAALGGATGTQPGAGAAGLAMPNSAAAGGVGAGDSGADVPVAPNVENTIRLELSEADADRWLETLRQVGALVSPELGGQTSFNFTQVHLQGAIA